MKTTSDKASAVFGFAERMNETLRSFLIRILRKWRRIVVLLTPGARVSRLHYYEARERYESLRCMLDHYQRIEEHQNRTKQNEEKLVVLRGCDELLSQASMYITRKQNDLNILWRLLTRARIMLVENMMRPESLPTQIDFCQEEALRLAVSNDVDIKARLARLAELIDEENPKKNAQPVYRRVRALMERFTTIRTGRIHQQYINIRTYQILLLFLLLIGLVLVNSWQLIILGEKSGTTDVPVFGAPVQDQSLYTLYWLWSSLKYIHLYVKHLLETNIFAFVFFGGLTGGFFSATIRIRDRDLTPGEDAYFIWYVITKPFVGAMGAILLYILVKGGLQDVAVLKGVHAAVQGPSLFGFAFLSGFSERIFFGGLQYAKKTEAGSEEAKT